MDKFAGSDAERSRRAGIYYVVLKGLSCGSDAIRLVHPDHTAPEEFAKAERILAASTFPQFVDQTLGALSLTCQSKHAASDDEQAFASRNQRLGKTGISPNFVFDNEPAQVVAYGLVDKSLSFFSRILCAAVEAEAATSQDLSFLVPYFKDSLSQVKFCNALTQTLAFDDYLVRVKGPNMSYFSFSSMEYDKTEVKQTIESVLWEPLLHSGFVSYLAPKLAKQAKDPHADPVLAVARGHLSGAIMALPNSGLGNAVSLEGGGSLSARPWRDNYSAKLSPTCARRLARRRRPRGSTPSATAARRRLRWR